MALRNILTWPSQALKKKSNPVVEFDEALGALAKDLYDTANVMTGVGIAAPQIGVHQRVVLINFDHIAEMESPHQSEGFSENTWVLVNPQLELSGPKHRWVEACLSVPDSNGHVERSQFVELKYQTLTGEEKSFSADWPLSGILQHECDHLDGVLYIDRMNRMSRDMLTKKIVKKRKKMEKMRKLMLQQEKDDLAGINGTRRKTTSANPTKKGKKRPAKKNHLNKKRRKKK